MHTLEDTALDANEQSSTKAEKDYVDDELAKKATTLTVTAMQQELEEKDATISKMQATIDVMNTTLKATATQAADCDANISTLKEYVDKEIARAIAARRARAVHEPSWRTLSSSRTSWIV